MLMTCALLPLLSSSDGSVVIPLALETANREHLVSKAAILSVLRRGKPGAANRSAVDRNLEE